MPTDSKVKKLNSFEIVVHDLQENPQPHPFDVMLAAAISQLTHKYVKTKQIGNTLFYLISDNNEAAQLGVYNADSEKRFIENTREMFVYCQKKLKLKHLVLDADTPEEIKVFNMVMEKPPLKNMHYESAKTENGKTKLVLTLGD